MTKAMITIWNASTGVVKVGEQKFVLKPAGSMVVQRDEAVDALVKAGKLVIVSVDEALSEEDEAPAARKKTKKDSAPAESKEETETLVLEQNEEQSLFESTEPSEDSILPEEPA